MRSLRPSTSPLRSLCLSRSQQLVIPGLVCTSIALAMNQMPFQAIYPLFAIGYLYPHVAIKVGLSFDYFCRQHRINTAALVALIAGASVLAILMMGVEPAHAQFFAKTEQWLKQTLQEGADSSNDNIGKMVALTFNVLRIIFVIYLGISLVKVVQAAREGEDWQTLARTPAIILLAVTLGDMLGSMITGNGSGGTTG